MNEAMSYGTSESERDETTGQFVAKYDEADFIDALRTLTESGSGATTQEVREVVDCPYRTAHEHLTRLEGDGRIQSRDVGRAKLWSLSDGESA